MAKINLQDGELARMQITKEQEVEISKLYHQTYLDLQKEMKGLSHEGSTSESLRKTYLNKLVKQLKESYKSIGEGLEKQIQKGMLDTAQAVVDNNSDWLKKAGLKVEGAYSYVPQDIVSLLSSGKLYGEGWSLSKAIWGDSQKKAHDIDQVVAAGVAANKSAYEIAKDLEQYVNPNAKKEWDWSKVYPGTTKKVDYNAQRLARTMVSHAYQQSLLATTKHNPFVTGYRWRSAHTHRTCELCNERDGQVYSANDLPLDHPNGMCTFLVELSGSLTDVADRLGNWVNGAEDPELDNWYKSMNLPKSQTAPQFNDLQKKWLEAYGFSPTNLPKNFSEWSHSVEPDQLSSLMSELGIWGKAHPYQELNKWYEANLLKTKNFPKVSDPIKKKIKPAPKPPSTGTPPLSRWIDGVKKNTESQMLKMEESSLGSLRDEQLKALKRYTGSSYEEMNGYLRNLGRGMTKEQAKSRSGISDSQIDSMYTAIKALDSIKTTEPLFLRRGSSLGDLAGLLPGDYSDNKSLLRSMSIEEINEMLQGAVGTYQGFTSTSSLYERGFSGELETIFYAPPGTSASSIMSISQYGTREGETLLNAGTQVRVISIEESDGHKGSRYRAYLEIIP